MDAAIHIRAPRTALWLFLVLFSSAPPAVAFEHTLDFSPVSISICAPDWTWQKRDINILIVARNTSGKMQSASVILQLPKGKEEHFAYAGEPIRLLDIPPGGTARAAFTGIAARDGVPVQVYTFSLAVKVGEKEEVMVYPVKTIRGAAVNPGKWALYLPAGVALIWCLAFAAALRWMAGPNAWRRLGPAVRPAPDRPAWIDGSDGGRYPDDC